MQIWCMLIYRGLWNEGTLRHHDILSKCEGPITFCINRGFDTWECTMTFLEKELHTNLWKRLPRASSPAWACFPFPEHTSEQRRHSLGPFEINIEINKFMEFLIAKIDGCRTYTLTLESSVCCNYCKYCYLLFVDGIRNVSIVNCPSHPD